MVAMIIIHPYIISVISLIMIVIANIIDELQ